MAESEYRTITVKRETKQWFDKVKRSGLSQDAFVKDLLDNWEAND